MMQLLDFKPLRKGTLRGFAKIRLPNSLLVDDIVLGESAGELWALFPGMPMLDRDGNTLRNERGKVRYRPVMKWESHATQREFSKRVADLVRAQHPEAFDDAGDGGVRLS
jgi:hypothetical protein